MLEQLFGSKTRVRLLRLFLNNSQDSYYVRELTRKIGAQINAVRNELGHLLALDLLQIVDEDGQPVGATKKRGPSRQKKYYRLNPDSLIYPELKALFVKSRVLLEKDLVRKIIGAGNVSYLALTGVFVGLAEAPTDVFIVGRIGKEKLTKLVREFEKEVGQEVNYTVMTPQEFKYRRDVTDRFLYSLLEAKKIVVLDKISDQS